MHIYMYIHAHHGLAYCHKWFTECKLYGYFFLQIEDHIWLNSIKRLLGLVLLTGRKLVDHLLNPLLFFLQAVHVGLQVSHGLARVHAKELNHKKHQFTI